MANFRVSEAVARTLWLQRTNPIAEVTDMLRKAHADLRDSVGRFAYTHGDVDFLSLNVSDLVKGWQDASDDAQLVTTQQQLFRRLDGNERELVANPMATSGLPPVTASVRPAGQPGRQATWRARGSGGHWSD